MVWTREMFCLAVVSVGLFARLANGDESTDLAQIAIPLEALAESFGNSGGLDIVRYFVGKVRVGQRRFYDKRHGGRAGVMAEEQMFDADGKLDGVCRQFHPNGKLFCEEPFRHGLQDGTFRYWDASGKLRGESLLRNGNGILRRFSLRYITGDNAEIPYVDGKIHGVKTNWGTTPAYGSGPCTRMGKRCQADGEKVSGTENGLRFLTLFFTQWAASTARWWNNRST